MQAGKLDRRITIQQESTFTRDSFGAKLSSWSDLATVWAEKRDLTARELFQAGQVYADVTTMFRIRYISGIDPKMRVSFESRYYNIRSVIDPTDQHRELQLLCSGGAT